MCACGGVECAQVCARLVCRNHLGEFSLVFFPKATFDLFVADDDALFGAGVTNRAVLAKWLRRLT